jgi:UDP-GlcNAc3NAcA epimerase
MKLLHIVGNRPQFIKLAPLLRAIQRLDKTVKNVIVHSGQHYDYDMSKIFFDELELPSPDHNLEVGSGTHGVQTGAILSKLDTIINTENPSVVIVYGDTNTTLAGSLAACKLHFPLAHVESGLREYVWRPEEINRKISDHCSDFLFCPTKTAVECLKKENIPDENIFLTGDITYDAFLWALAKPRYDGKISNKGEKYVLLTLHRGETVDYEDILSEIIQAIIEMQDKIVFPAHPRTVKFLQKFDLMKKIESASNIKLIPPAGYFDFLNLLVNASLVITDSGGVIKESFFAKKPCIVLDYTTEYKEILEAGSHIWVGKEKKAILDAKYRLDNFDTSNIAPEIVFGDGKAAEKMISIIFSHLGSKK